MGVMEVFVVADLQQIPMGRSMGDLDAVFSG
jgi:hypothetical protein